MTIWMPKKLRQSGIKLHENLSQKVHINAVSNKISKTIGILTRLKSYVPSKI